MELKNVKYDAFISYRHSQHDMFIAKSIHRRLENFNVPKSVLAKGLCEKTKIERVFRDQDELPLADNLSDPIDNALSNSEFLIVICTPRLPESKWCLKEITTFLKTHDREHILVVLAEGEPEESFPYELTHEKIMKVDADGNTVIEEREIEPLAADVRGKDKRETEKLLDDATLRLCAAIFGLNYDDLKQRHKEQQNARRIKIAVGVSAVSIAFAAVCLFLLTTIKSQNTQIMAQNEQITAQNDTISQQYDQIQEKYQSAMVSCSSELFEKGRRKDSLYALTHEVDEEKLNSNTALMLSKALYSYDVGSGYYPNCVYENANGIADTIISKDGRYLAALDNLGSVNIFDTQTDERIATFSNIIKDTFDTTVYDFDTEYFYYRGEDGTHRVNIYSFEDEFLSESAKQIFSHAGFPGVYAVSNGKLNYYTDDGAGDYEISLWDYDEEHGENDLPVTYVEDYSFSSDNKTMSLYVHLGVSYIPYVFVIDTATGRVRTEFIAEDSLTNALATSNDMVFISRHRANGVNSAVFGVDINTAEQVWYSFLSMDYIKDLFYDDVNDRVIAQSTSDVVVLDATYGDVYLEDSLGDNAIVKAIVSNGKVDIFAEDCSRYTLPQSSDNILDITFYTYISTPPTGVKLKDVSGSNGNIYLSFEHSNSVIKYSYIELGEEIGDVSQEEYEQYTAFKGTEIENKEYNVVNSIRTADGEYIFTLLVDGSVVVKDKTGNTVSMIYNFDGAMTDIDRIDELGVYIIHSYSNSFLLNKDMQIVARMRRYVKYEDGYMYITTGSKLYRVKYITPAEMLKQAKEIIGDYECDEPTKSRYGIR